MHFIISAMVAVGVLGVLACLVSVVAGLLVEQSGEHYGRHDDEWRR